MVKETLVVQGICYSCVLLLRPQYCRTTVKKKGKKRRFSLEFYSPLKKGTHLLLP